MYNAKQTNKTQDVVPVKSVFFVCELTHWGQVAHLCVGNSTIIGSDNGLSSGRRQAIILINAGILSTGPLGTNLSEILIEIHAFSFKKMRFKISSGKRRPFCLGFNVLTVYIHICTAQIAIHRYRAHRPFVIVIHGCHSQSLHQGQFETAWT